ncbi:MAG: ParA family protein [Oscillospiraceae bacterium]|nr:ParA family protein [Oscillospiraceae bacterium]
MGKVTALFNQKGGVGKTTTCVNLCASFKALGLSCLIVDSDPQGHSTSGMGIDKNTVYPSTYNVLIEGVPAEKAIVSTRYGDVIPCNKGLFGSGIILADAEEREFVLKKALEPIKERYDCILIDCPALLELLTLNALCAADSILIPVQCEYLALEGLSDLMSSVKMIRRSLNPSLEVEGVLLTMFDGRTNLSLQIANEVKKHLRGTVFKTVIPRNVRLSEAPSHGRPVTAYDRGSRGAAAYMELAREIAGKNGWEVEK